MIVHNVFKRWFEEQLRFSFPDGTEEESVLIGTAHFSAVDILNEFDATYKEEFNRWLNEDWKPVQHEIREEVLSYSANADRYLDLRNASNRQQVIPLVGSGMSVPSGLPTWVDFLMRVRDFTQCSMAELQRLINSSSFEEAADLLASGTNPRLLAERIEHDLRISNPDVINGPICLLPSLFPNLVITTNLDRVLEHLYQSCNMPFGIVLWGKQFADYRRLKDPGGRFLLKLHGDCQDQEGRVLLSHEYEAAYAPNSPSREELTLLYRQYSLLFLGCSLGSDRTVRLLEDVAAADSSMPRHYALLAKPEDENDENSREQFLTERGIFPIWYDLSHEDAIMALLDGLSADENG